MKTLNLNLKRDTIRICLDDDKNRCFEFNPNDINLYGRIKAFYVAIRDKYEKFAKMETEFDDQKLMDENQDPTEAGLAFIEAQVEIGEFVSKNFDMIFGDGVYFRLFGNEFDPNVFGEVIGFILKQLGDSRKEKIDKELKKPASKSKKVMK